MPPDSAATDNARASPVAIARAYDAFAITVVGVVLLLLVGAFVWPWLPQLVAPQAAHQRYTPLAHGDAATRVTLDADGTPIAWTTDNLTALSAWQIFDASFSESLGAHLLNLLPELLAAGQFGHGTSLFRSNSRTLLADGSSSTSETYLLRRARSDEVIAVYSAAAEVEDVISL